MHDYFHRLGMPRRFSIDATELERAYLAHSRAAHPDYHLAGSSSELHASQELSAELNTAYTTLRDPFTRAEHLLTLEGGPSATEHKQLPPAFLAEMLDAREEIEVARGNAPACDRLAEKFDSRFTAIMQEIADCFAKIATLAGDDSARVNLHTRVRGLLNAGKYIRGLIRDLNSD